MCGPSLSGKLLTGPFEVYKHSLALGRSNGVFSFGLSDVGMSLQWEFTPLVTVAEYPGGPITASTTGVAKAFVISDFLTSGQLVIHSTTSEPAFLTSRGSSQ